MYLEKVIILTTYKDLSNFKINRKCKILTKSISHLNMRSSYSFKNLSDFQMSKSNFVIFSL